MKRVLFLAALWAAAVPLFASFGEGNPRIERLYSAFMSPCCWQQNLALHDSQIAQEMRGRIQSMVKEGRSDEAIKAVFIRQYGKRILALPEGAERTWLFVTPWAAGCGGLLAAIDFLRRASARRYDSMPGGFTPAELEAGWEREI
ncbi:MAG TPA: cytochrome c-type biogenesis protein CcmH [Bryobacteraceae bacterium]|nr:cytochrome c-type biogenesis protein CcmH [Bryobacteraceae bacterium]